MQIWLFLILISFNLNTFAQENKSDEDCAKEGGIQGKIEMPLDYSKNYDLASKSSSPSSSAEILAFKLLLKDSDKNKICLEDNQTVFIGFDSPPTKELKHRNRAMQAELEKSEKFQRNFSEPLKDGKLDLPTARFGFRFELNSNRIPDKNSKK